MENQEVSGEQISEAAAPVDDVQYESHDIESKQVPLDALQAERAQRQNLQEELRVLKDHIALMQAQQQKPQHKDELESLSDDDVLTVGEAKKFLSKINQETKMSLEELRMTQKNPDYEHVISKYLPEVLKENPKLRNTLQATQDYELAYYLAKNSDAYKASNKQEKRNSDAERIIKNSQQAGSLSSVGGTSPVNTARRYKDMSDAEFRKLVSRNMGYN